MLHNIFGLMETFYYFNRLEISLSTFHFQTPRFFSSILNHIFNWYGLAAFVTKIPSVKLLSQGRKFYGL